MKLKHMIYALEMSEYKQSGFNSSLHCKNAGLLQPMVGSNIDKCTHWVYIKLPKIKY